MLQVGTGRQIITPERGVSLAGYFNPRPNTGVLDDLAVKAVLFRKGAVVGGLVSLDLGCVTLHLADGIKNGLQAKGYGFAENLIIAATHTHTGPDLHSAGTGPDDRIGLNAKQFASLVDKTVCAVEEAYANLLDSTLGLAKVNNNPCAFNRRYWMKDGTVQTNPGKLNPGIDRPEGPVDDEISVLAVKQDGRIAVMVVNICNHNDTVSGSLVSADWPGRMERHIQDALGYDVPVVTLIGCSGNINHLDVTTGDEYYGYHEACRIGNIYGGIVMALLDVPEPVAATDIRVDSSDFAVPYQFISDERGAAAEAVIERIGDVSSGENLTSEGIASGDGAVAKMFAEQILAFKARCSGKSRTFKLVNIKIGRDLMFISSPGEPFTEAGLRIKEKSPFKYNFVTSHAMGACGYMCMPECYQRGGYEILPVVNGGPEENTIMRLMEAWEELVNK